LNGRYAHFYELWGGETLRPGTFRQELHARLTQVFAPLIAGKIQAQVARQLPLERPVAALLAQLAMVAGKVVLGPSRA